jgi:hypothetical protein
MLLKGQDHSREEDPKEQTREKTRETYARPI